MLFWGRCAEQEKDCHFFLRWEGERVCFFLFGEGGEEGRESGRFFSRLWLVKLMVSEATKLTQEGRELSFGSVENGSEGILRSSVGAGDRVTTGTTSMRPVGSFFDMRDVRSHGVRASSSMYDFFARSASIHNIVSFWKGLRGSGQRGELDLLSLLVVYFVTLVSEAARGLVLPSQWPFLESVGGSKAFLGVLVASFSLGRMVSTVPLGYLSDKMSMRGVLVFCSCLQIIGNTGYALSENQWMLVISRVIVGFGSATMSVCRAHITRSTLRNERTYHFAYLSALQFIGFAVLPGAGGLLTALPVFDLGPFPFNSYSDAGWVLLLANIVVIGLLITVYDDPPMATRSTIPRKADAESPEQIPNNEPDYLALSACVLINICFRGVVAQLETVAAPFIMEKFSYSMEGASFLITAMGCVGLIIYLCFKPISRAMSDVNLVLIGLLFATVAGFIFSVFHDYLNLPMYIFTLGLIWSIAYPLGQTAVLGLFSKKLGSLPAGEFLGIFSAGGSLARLSFASMTGVIWSRFGRYAVFELISLYMTVTLIFTIFVYKRLKPRYS